MSFQNPVFIPGPTNMPEALRRACDMPTLDHRSAAFADILQPAREGVRRILRSAMAEVFIFPATGTGGWEVAITNTLSRGDTVLAARNGMFSHRWIDMCQRHGLTVEIVETPWGEGIPADRFEEILRADTDGRIKAVLATHNETATGVLSDIAAVRAAMDAAGHDALLFVDGVSSIASMPFEFDTWGVDVAVTGSQKGFMLPAGLAITGFSSRALAAVETGGLPRCFLRHPRHGQKLCGERLSLHARRGPSERARAKLRDDPDRGARRGFFARHARIAGGVRAAVTAWGLDLCAARPELYSNSVSAIRTPEGFDATRIVTHAADTYGVAFGVGLGEVAGKVFRIGHLGMLTDVLALSGIATAEMAMADLGLDIKLGSGVAAAQEVYRSTAAPLALAAE